MLAPEGALSKSSPDRPSQLRVRAAAISAGILAMALTACGSVSKPNKPSYFEMINNRLSQAMETKLPHFSALGLALRSVKASNFYAISVAREKTVEQLAAGDHPKTISNYETAVLADSVYHDRYETEFNIVATALNYRKLKVFTDEFDVATDWPTITQNYKRGLRFETLAQKDAASGAYGDLVAAWNEFFKAENAYNVSSDLADSLLHSSPKATLVVPVSLKQNQRD